MGINFFRLLFKGLTVFALALLFFLSLVGCGGGQLATSQADQGRPALPGGYEISPLPWPAKRPLTVQIIEDSQYPSFAELVQAAMQDWKPAVRLGPITYVTGGTDRPADIVVRVVDTVDPDNDRVVGQARCRTRYDQMEEVQIVVASGLDAYEVRRVIEHEFGHALGMPDHSPDSRDIMYYAPWLATVPSQADLFLVGWVNRVEAGVRPAPIGYGEDREPGHPIHRAVSDEEKEKEFICQIVAHD